MSNNILVIGNGFDIAHGLNTSYLEFIDFCDMIGKLEFIEESNVSKLIRQINKNKHDSNHSFEQSVYRKITNYFSNSKYLNNDKFSMERKKFIKGCKNNFWLKYVLEHRSIMGNRWTDFEYIIGSIVEAHAYISNNLKDFKKEQNFQYRKDHKNIEEVYQLLDKYNNSDLHDRLSMLKEEMEEGLNDITWMLEVYLTRFLNNKRKKLELFDIVDFRYILSFNYTSTYAKMYKKEAEIHYVHGSADADRDRNENNMVFGIEKTIRNVDENSKYDYLEFQKYYQRIIKKTGLKYRSWLEIKDSKLKYSSKRCNIFIYGHSLDYPDGDIIRDLIDCVKSTVFIFYHDKKAFKSLVANLIKIYSEDEVIQFTEEEKIIFLETSDINSVKKYLNLKDNA